MWLTVGAILLSSLAVTNISPTPPGRLIDVGGHRLHLYCTGHGSPVVVIETGLGDISTDWTLVQERVSRHTRVCTYDRAGYGWSDPGPMPRTFAQLNLELRDLLARGHESGPFVLVGHSFGGGVVRQFAYTYPRDVAGVVFVDIVADRQLIQMGPSHAGRIGDSATGRSIPSPREAVTERDDALAPDVGGKIDAPYQRLSVAAQQWHQWAQRRRAMQTAEDSQREWSAEYFARWTSNPQAGTLGSVPLLVLSRARAVFSDRLDVSASELERARLDAQGALADLSSASSQWLVSAGHNMQLDAPDMVSAAILDVVNRASNANH